MVSLKTLDLKFISICAQVTLKSYFSALKILNIKYVCVSVYLWSKTKETDFSQFS